MASQFSITNTGTFDVLAGSNVLGKPFSASPIPPTGVVASSLLVHLDAGNPTSYPGTGTTWYNLVAGGLYDGTLTHNLFEVPTFVDSGSASYFQFTNGASASKSQTVNISSSLSLQTDFSLEIWVRYGESTEHALFGQGVKTANNGLHVSDSNFNNIAFNMYSNDYSVSSTLTLNVWRQVVLTYSNTSPYTKTIYRNGSKLGNSTTGQSAYTGTGTFRIGNHFSSGNGYTTNKRISVVRIYNKVLSDAEVLQNYNANKSRYGL